MRTSPVLSRTRALKNCSFPASGAAGERPDVRPSPIDLRVTTALNIHVALSVGSSEAIVTFQ